MAFTFLIGLLIGGGMMALAWLGGYPAWVIQQATMMLLALNIVPFARRIPLLNQIGKDVDHLVAFYEKHPQLTSPFYTLLRLVPLTNFLVFWRELGTMLLIALVGIPLDILLEAFETYVLTIPNWGLAAEQNYSQRIFASAFLTVLYTPYVMLVVLSLRNLLGIRVSREAVEEVERRKHR